MRSVSYSIKFAAIESKLQIFFLINSIGLSISHEKSSVFFAINPYFVCAPKIWMNFQELQFQVISPQRLNQQILGCIRIEDGYRKNFQTITILWDSGNKWNLKVDSHFRNKDSISKSLLFLLLNFISIRPGCFYPGFLTNTDEIPLHLKCSPYSINFGYPFKDSSSIHIKGQPLGGIINESVCIWLAPGDLDNLPYFFSKIMRD